jgi:hypothetical protein
MAQGSGYLKKSASKVKNASAKPSKKVKQYSNKLSAAKFTKKGSTYRSWWARERGVSGFIICPLLRRPDGRSAPRRERF